MDTNTDFSSSFKVEDLGNGYSRITTTIDFSRNPIPSDTIEDDKNFDGAVSYAQDGEESDATVKTPFFKCRAADPMRCRFHGPAAIKKFIEDEMSKIASSHASIDIDVKALKDGKISVEMKCPNDFLVEGASIFKRLPHKDDHGVDPWARRGVSSKTGRVSALLDIDYLDKTATEESSDGHADATSDPSSEPDSSPKWKTIGEFMLDASKTLVSAARTINRHIDSGDFDPNTSKVDRAISMRDGIFSVFNDESASKVDQEQADKLLDAIHEMENSKANGYKDRISNIPIYTPTPDASSEEPDHDEKKMDDDLADSILEDKGEASSFLRAMAVDTPDGALKDAILARLEEEDALVASATEMKKSKETPKPAEPAAPDSTTTSDEPKSAWPKFMSAGDSASEINAKRIAEGLAPYRSLEKMDKKIESRTKAIMEASKELAARFGDPELDISDPKVYALVEKNFAESVKKMYENGRLVSFAEPRHIFGFLSDGEYKTAFGSDSEMTRNFKSMYGLTASDKDEAPLSATIVSSEEKKSFDTPCSRRFGPIYIEWDKKSDLVPLFSNCDAAEPATQDSGLKESDKKFLPTPISSTRLCSLSMFCSGDSSVTELVGRRSSSGMPITSYLDTIKKLRKGEISSDPKEFDSIVNGADKSPFHSSYGRKMEFGWNESPVVGKGTTDKCAAIHVDSDSWKKMASSEYPHGTGEMSPTEFVERIKRDYGMVLKDKGIKLVLDGREVAL